MATRHTAPAFLARHQHRIELVQSMLASCAYCKVLPPLQRRAFLDRLKTIRRQLTAAHAAWAAVVPCMDGFAALFEAISDGGGGALSHVLDRAGCERTGRELGKLQDQMGRLEATWQAVAHLVGEARGTLEEWLGQHAGHPDAHRICRAITQCGVLRTRLTDAHTEGHRHPSPNPFRPPPHPWNTAPPSPSRTPSPARTDPPSSNPFFTLS